MRIKELIIVGFGKLVNQHFRFAETLHVVKGFNEAGKSTLVNAVLGVLYGFKGRSDEIKGLKEMYRPWKETVPYRAALVVNFGDEFDYVIERDFQEDWVNLYKRIDSEQLPVNVTIEELIAEKLGITSGRLFKSTLLVKQEEVSELHRTELTDAIIRKITESGSGISIKEILQILGDRLKELHRGFGRQTPNPGPMKTCLEDIKKIKDEFNEVMAYYVEYNELISLLRQKQKNRESLLNRVDEIAPVVKEYEDHQLFTERLTGLKRQLQELESVNEKITEKESELSMLQGQVSLLKEHYLTLENLQRVEFLDRKLNVTEQRMDHVNGEYQKVKSKRQLVQREMGNHSKTIANYYSVRYNENNFNEARRLQAAIAGIREEIAEKEQRLENLNAYQSPRFSWTFWFGLTLCAISAVGIFTGNIWGYVVASILLVSGLIVIYFGGINSQYGISKELAKITQSELERLKTNLQTYQRMLEGILDGEDIDSFEGKVKEQIHLKQKIGLLEEELHGLDIEPLEQEIVELRKDINQYLHQISEFLVQANVGSVEEFREKLEELKNLKSEIRLATDSLAFLRNETNEENTDKVIADMRHEIEGIEKVLLNQVVPEGLYMKLKEELGAINTLLEQAREDEIKTAASVENYNRLILQDRDIWSLETALAEKEDHLKQLELESKSIELAIKTIQEATEEARSKLAPQVKDKVIKIFQWITRKRYRDVRLEMDGEKLVFQFQDNEFDLYRNVHYLSTGTRDQLYLALRIALGEYLTKSKTFPIFLDDPFVNFDLDRLNKTVEILRVLAREHQIIWLTKDFDMVEEISEAKVTQL